jgi:hypothetical protein
MDEAQFDSWTRRRFGLTTAAASLLGLAGLRETVAKKKPKPKPPKPDAKGRLVRSLAALNSDGGNCIPNAKGTISIFKLDGVERMEVSVSGMPKNKTFDVFVIQDPDKDFGMSWYQGDLETDKNGNGTQTFIGRFSIETFIVAPGPKLSPQIHTDQPFPDQVGNNPVTAPVHTFHVGLWFDSPEDAAAAQCDDTETPFNGDHTAGIQALRSVPVGDLGPLAQID